MGKTEIEKIAEELERVVQAAEKSKAALIAQGTQLRFAEAKAIIAAQVTRGAVNLDHNMSRWFMAIDLGRLDMSSNTNCVLGQLWDPDSDGRSCSTGFHRGMQYLFRVLDCDAEADKAQEYGYGNYEEPWEHNMFPFASDHMDALDEFHQACWVREVRYRMGGRAPA